MRSQGAADAAALAAKSVDVDVDGTALIAAEGQIPTWRQRDFTDVPIGTPYRYKDQVYKLWQQHTAIGHQKRQSVFGISVIRRTRKQQKNM